MLPTLASRGTCRNPESLLCSQIKSSMCLINACLVTRVQLVRRLLCPPACACAFLSALVVHRSPNYILMQHKRLGPDCGALKVHG